MHSPHKLPHFLTAGLLAIALSACAARATAPSTSSEPRSGGQPVALQPTVAPVPALVEVVAAERRLPAAETGRADEQGVRQRVALEERVGGRWPLVRVEEEVAADGTVRARREMVGDHLLVSAKPGTTAAAMAALAARHGCAVRDHIHGTPVWLLSFPVPDHRAFPAARAALAGEPELVAVAEPDWIVRGTGTPSDQLFGELWGMHNAGQAGGMPDADIDAPEAWDIATGSRSVLVGVIDSGIDATHPDLAANMWTNPGETGTDANGQDRKANGIDDDGNGYVDDWRGWDFVANDNNPADEHGHGTHCAGTIGGVGGNGVGVTGVCWKVSLVGLRFLDAGGAGTTSGAIGAVAYANALHVDLTSNSWGGGGYSQALKDAIDAANAQNIAFIAAAGNNAANTDVSVNYPSCYDSPNIIAVAATTRTDGMASFSNYGAATVDLGAPGQDILSCKPGGTYQLMSGTSMATPHVAGAYALLKSVAPGQGVSALKTALLAYADPIPALAGKTVSGGRLNLLRALQTVAGPLLQVQSFQLFEQGNGDGWISPGEAARLRWLVGNVGGQPTAPILRNASCSDTRIAIAGGQAQMPPLAPGESVWIDGVIATAPAGVPTPLWASVTLTLTSTTGGLSDIEALQVARVATMAGTVRRQGDNALMPGAKVAWSGQNASSVLTDAGGAFSVRIPEGTYSVVASATGYPQAPAQTVVLPPDAMLSLMLPSAPDLRVTPASLAITVAQGATASAPVTLANIGGAPLTWSAPASPVVVTGLWHRSSYRDYDSDGSWYYGLESTHTYDTGAANAGDLVFDGVAVPTANPLLTFREWRLTESGTSFDRSTVEISTTPGVWTVAGQSTWQGASWSQATVNLSAWAGSSVRLRFRFDTVDGIANAFEGWYIDDLRLNGSPLSGWASMAPTSGSIPGGTSAAAMVTVAAGSMAPGSYSTTLRVSSNDPDQPSTDIPMTMTVIGVAKPEFAGRTVSDAALPPAAGDGDGFAEPGETVAIAVQVRNAGGVASGALTGTLACTASGVSIPDASYPLPALAAGATVSGPQRAAAIGAAVADGAVLPFSLTLSDGVRSWSLPFTVVVDRRIRVTGTVRSEPANAALVNAQVTIAGISTYSGAGGAFTVTGLKPGTPAASASYPGYLTATASLALTGDGTWNPVLGTRLLTVTPMTIDRTITKGSNDAVSLSLSASGTRSTTFSISVLPLAGGVTTPWLSIAPASGTVAVGSPVQATISAASAALAAGIYDRTLQIVSDDTTMPTRTLTYRLRVQSANAPVVQPLSATTLEDTTVDIPLAASDADGDALTLALAAPSAAKGTVALVNGTTLRYVPKANANGTDTVWVTASDGMRTSAAAAITLTITPVNDPPELAALKLRAARDIATSLHLALRDPDGTPASWTIIAAPSHGSLSGSAPDLVYRPQPGFIGGDAFTVRATDPEGMTAERTMTIAVEAPTREWPTFGNNTARTGFAAVGLPPSITAAPAWSAAFDHQLNQVAVGGDRVYVTPYKASSGTVWAAARDLGTGLQAWSAALPGAASRVSPPTWDAGQVFFQRDDSAGSQVHAVQAASGTTLWTAPFLCQYETRFAPLAAGGRVYVNGGTYGGMYGFDRTTGVQSFFLSGPQFDLWSPSWYDGVVYSYVGTDVRAHDPTTGAVSWSTPIPTAFFGYSMNRVPVLADGLALVVGADSSAGLYAVDLATHAIRWSVVGPFIGSPAVANGRVFVGSSLGVSSFDLASGMPLESYSGAGAFTGLQPIVTADGLIARCGATTAIWRIGQAAPAATIPFGGHLSLAGDTLLIAENTGSAYATTGTLRAFRLGNRPPAVVGAVAACNEDTSTTGIVAASDADGDPLTASVAQAPAHGVATLSGLGWTYVPAANWNGSDSFTVRVSDGAATADAAITVAVAAVNDLPVASALSGSTSANVPLLLTPQAVDADGETPTWKLVALPATGVAAIINGKLRYTPPANWTGGATFTYAAVDAIGTGPTATVTVTVIGEGLPVPWIDRALGIPAGKPVGGSSYGWTARQFTVGGGGNNIWDPADQFRFLSQPVSGDVTIIGQLLAQDATDPWARAGLMIRDGLATNARYVLLCRTPNNGILTQFRSSIGGVTNIMAKPQRIQPWFKMQRVGNVFTTWVCEDGVTWGSPIGIVTVLMAPQVEVGMAVTSHKDTVISNGRFGGVQLVLPAAPAAVNGLGMLPGREPLLGAIAPR